MIAAIRHSAIQGHTVLLSQADEIHENFYDLFNQHFTRINNPQHGIQYYANVAIGAHVKPSRVDPSFQCMVVIKESEVKSTPAPFLNRFEKYTLSHHVLLQDLLTNYQPQLRHLIESSKAKVCLHVPKRNHSLFLSFLSIPFTDFVRLGWIVFDFVWFYMPLRPAGSNP